MRAVSHRTGRPAALGAAEAKSFFTCEAFHMPRTIPHAIWPRSETMVHVPTPAFPSPLRFVFPRDFGPHSQRRLAHVPTATLPQVPRAPLTPGRPAPPSHPRAPGPRLRARPPDRRAGPRATHVPDATVVHVPSSALSGVSHFTPPAHVPSARLAHVPVATSHDVRVDALLPLFSACRSRYSAGHSHR